jgi:hypothetical protein
MSSVELLDLQREMRSGVIESHPISTVVTGDTLDQSATAPLITVPGLKPLRTSLKKASTSSAPSDGVASGGDIVVQASGMDTVFGSAGAGLELQGEEQPSGSGGSTRSNLCARVQGRGRLKGSGGAPITGMRPLHLLCFMVGVERAAPLGNIER